MSSVKIVIPHEDLPAYPAEQDMPLPAAAKLALTSLLKSGGADVLQMPPATAGVQRVTVWLPQDLCDLLDRVCARHPLLVNRTDAATAVLHAGARASLAERGLLPAQPLRSSAIADRSPLDRANAALGQSTNPDQARYYDGIRSYLRAAQPGQVLFAEASTGTGKTRAFIAAAIEWSHSTGRPAIVAVPSLAVLDQTVREALRISAQPPLQASVAAVVGMREFVSAHRLDSWIAANTSDPDVDLVRAWRDRGACAAPGHVIQRRWTVAGLLAAVPSFGYLEDVELTSYDHDEDDGKRTYRQQFVDGHSADLVLCTHAMLASDVQIAMRLARNTAKAELGEKALAAIAQEFFARDKATRGVLHHSLNDTIGQYVDQEGKRLPSDALLIVDEAHLLETNFSVAFGYGVSLWRLVGDLRTLRAHAPRLIRQSQVDAANEAWQMLRAAGSRTTADSSYLSDPSIRDPLLLLSKAIGNVNAGSDKALKALPEFVRLREAARCLTMAHRTADKASMFGMVTWSPTRSYPRLLFGRADVSAELDFLWTTVARFGVVVSATLYERQPELSIESIRVQLGVRPTKAVMMTPVTPAWVYEPVTVVLPAKQFVPSQAGDPKWLRFTRPRSRDQLNEQERKEKYAHWVADVSNHTAKAYRSAAGGVLVLGTAYSDIRAVKEQLAKMGEPTDPRLLLIQQEGTALSTLRRRFLDLSRQGHRPLLLAVGSAWTGLDLAPDFHVDAPSDTVLTDLVILNAPIGTNRTITHMRRRERLGPIADLGPAQMTFRQGIGRLVRRPGLPANRRLHFLDGRIHDHAWSMYMTRLMRALAHYPRRKEVRQSGRPPRVSRAVAAPPN